MGNRSSLPSFGHHMVDAGCLWVSDDHRVSCFHCENPFTKFKCRRHHCRVCGELFCNTKKTVINRDGTKGEKRPTCWGTRTQLTSNLFPPFVAEAIEAELAKIQQQQQKKNAGNKKGGNKKGSTLPTDADGHTVSADKQSNGDVRTLLGYGESIPQLSQREILELAQLLAHPQPICSVCAQIMRTPLLRPLALNVRSLLSSKDPHNVFVVRVVLHGVTHKRSSGKHDHFVSLEAMAAAERNGADLEMLVVTMMKDAKARRKRLAESVLGNPAQLMEKSLMSASMNHQFGNTNNGSPLLLGGGNPNDAFMPITPQASAVDFDGVHQPMQLPPTLLNHPEVGELALAMNYMVKLLRTEGEGGNSENTVENGNMVRSTPSTPTRPTTPLNPERSAIMAAASGGNDGATVKPTSPTSTTDRRGPNNSPPPQGVAAAAPSKFTVTNTATNTNAFGAGMGGGGGMAGINSTPPLQPAAPSTNTPNFLAVPDNAALLRNDPSSPLLTDVERANFFADGILLMGGRHAQPGQQQGYLHHHFSTLQSTPSGLALDSSFDKYPLARSNGASAPVGMGRPNGTSSTTCTLGPSAPHNHGIVGSIPLAGSLPMAGSFGIGRSTGGTDYNDLSKYAADASSGGVSGSLPRPNDASTAPFPQRVFGGSGYYEISLEQWRPFNKQTRLVFRTPDAAEVSDRPHSFGAVGVDTHHTVKLRKVHAAPKAAMMAAKFAEYEARKAAEDADRRAGGNLGGGPSSAPMGNNGKPFGGFVDINSTGGGMGMAMTPPLMPRGGLASLPAGPKSPASPTAVTITHHTTTTSHPNSGPNTPRQQLHNKQRLSSPTSAKEKQDIRAALHSHAGNDEDEDDEEGTEEKKRKRTSTAAPTEEESSGDGEVPSPIKADAVSADGAAAAAASVTTATAGSSPAAKRTPPKVSSEVEMASTPSTEDGGIIGDTTTSNAAFTMGSADAPTAPAFVANSSAAEKTDGGETATAVSATDNATTATTSPAASTTADTATAAETKPSVPKVRSASMMHVHSEWDDFLPPASMMAAKKNEPEVDYDSNAKVQLVKRPKINRGDGSAGGAATCSNFSRGVGFDLGPSAHDNTNTNGVSQGNFIRGDRATAAEFAAQVAKIDAEIKQQYEAQQQKNNNTSTSINDSNRNSVNISSAIGGYNSAHNSTLNAPDAIGMGSLTVGSFPHANRSGSTLRLTPNPMLFTAFNPQARSGAITPAEAVGLNIDNNSMFGGGQTVNNFGMSQSNLNFNSSGGGNNNGNSNTTKSRFASGKDGTVSVSNFNHAYDGNNEAKASALKKKTRRGKRQMDLNLNIDDKQLEVTMPASWSLGCSSIVGVDVIEGEALGNPKYTAEVGEIEGEQLVEKQIRAVAALRERELANGGSGIVGDGTTSGRQPHLRFATPSSSNNPTVSSQQAPPSNTNVAAMLRGMSSSSPKTSMRNPNNSSTLERNNGTDRNTLNNKNNPNHPSNNPIANSFITQPVIVPMGIAGKKYLRIETFQEIFYFCIGNHLHEDGAAGNGKHTDPTSPDTAATLAAVRQSQIHGASTAPFQQAAMPISTVVSAIRHPCVTTAIETNATPATPNYASQRAALDRHSNEMDLCQAVKRAVDVSHVRGRVRVSSVKLLKAGEENGHTVPVGYINTGAPY